MQGRSPPTWCQESDVLPTSSSCRAATLITNARKLRNAPADSQTRNRLSTILVLRPQSSSMASTQSYINDLSDSLDDKLAVSSTPQRSNALSNKLSGVLSASYVDSEIRDALRNLDESEIRNTAETRRRLRLDVQKHVIQRNAAVVQEFGHVAEVRLAQRL